MKLADIVEKIGLQVLTAPETLNADIQHVYAGDRISDLLNHATDRTLVVTNLNGPPLLRVAELMEIPAICLVNGVIPESEMVKAARDRRKAILVSPLGMFETCGRMYLAFQCDAKAKG